MGYIPCLAYPDLWIKDEVRPDNGEEYNAYVLLFIDDVLSINHDTEDVLR